MTHSIRIKSVTTIRSKCINQNRNKKMPRFLCMTCTVRQVKSSRWVSLHFWVFYFIIPFLNFFFSKIFFPFFLVRDQASKKWLYFSLSLFLSQCVTVQSKHTDRVRHSRLSECLELNLELKKQSLHTVSDQKKKIQNGEG